MVRIAITALLLSAALGVAAIAEPSPQGDQGAGIGSTSILSAGSVLESLGVRLFGGDEGLAYVDGSYRRGIGQDSEVLLRISAAGRKDLALGGDRAIRHGGVDVELALRRKPWANSPVALQVGLAEPTTPARSTPCLTLGADAAAFRCRAFQVTVGPKAALFRHNSLVGVGVGISARVAEGWSLAAGCTPLIAGDNTRDTSDGSMMRRTLYSVALHYACRDGALTAGLGWSNATGCTTGSSLTPGLGGSQAITLTIGARR